MSAMNFLPFSEGLGDRGDDLRKHLLLLRTSPNRVMASPAPSLWIDVSSASKSSANTGVQRVVRSLFREAAAYGRTQAADLGRQL